MSALQPDKLATLVDVLSLMCREGFGRVRCTTINSKKEGKKRQIEKERENKINKERSRNKKEATRIRFEEGKHQQHSFAGLLPRPACRLATRSSTSILFTSTAVADFCAAAFASPRKNEGEHAKNKPKNSKRKNKLSRNLIRIQGQQIHSTGFKR